MREPPVPYSRKEKYLTFAPAFFGVLLLLLGYAVGSGSAAQQTSADTPLGALEPNKHGDARMVYINGWQIDTQLYPNVDSSAAVPLFWPGYISLPKAEKESESTTELIALIQISEPASWKVQIVETYLNISLKNHQAKNAYVLVASPATVMKARFAPYVSWVHLFLLAT